MKLPTIFTILWLLLFGVWALIADSKAFECTYESYAHFRLYLTIPFVLAAFTCIWAFASCDIFRSTSTAALGDWTVAGVIFWVLFPPIWFFTEYRAADAGVFTGADLNKLKNYADFASKVWAAFLALYLFVVTQRIKVREEELKAKAPK